MSPSADFHGPSFLGIGAPRAGTSWLHAQLRVHPQLWLSPIKELHYWDLQRRGSRKHYPLHDRNWWTLRVYFAAINVRTLVVRTSRRQIPLSWAMRYALGFNGDRWYRSLFPRDRIGGEITPGYMLLAPAVIEQIRQANPEIKAILLLRNPVSRAWSNICHSLQARVRTASIDKLRAMLEAPNSIERGNYVRTIENWRTVLGDDRVFIGFYDDLVADPSGLLRRVFEFLGVDASDERMPGNLRREVNAAKEKRALPEELRAHTYRLYFDQLVLLESMLGGHVSHWLAKAEEALAGRSA